MLCRPVVGDRPSGQCRCAASAPGRVLNPQPSACTILHRAIRDGHAVQVQIAGSIGIPVDPAAHIVGVPIVVQVVWVRAVLDRDVLKRRIKGIRSTRAGVVIAVWPWIDRESHIVAICVDDRPAPGRGPDKRHRAQNLKMRHRIALRVKRSRLPGQVVGSRRKHDRVGRAAGHVDRRIGVRKNHRIAQRAYLRGALRAARAVIGVGRRSSVIRKRVRIEGVSRARHGELRSSLTFAEHRQTWPSIRIYAH